MAPRFKTTKIASAIFSQSAGPEAPLKFSRSKFLDIRHTQAVAEQRIVLGWRRLAGHFSRSEKRRLLKLFKQRHDGLRLPRAHQHVEFDMILVARIFGRHLRKTQSNQLHVGGHDASQVVEHASPAYGTASDQLVIENAF